jgi:hypothetical protein
VAVVQYTFTHNSTQNTEIGTYRTIKQIRNIHESCGMDTTGEKEKRTSKKNLDGRSTISHDNKEFRARSMEKQRGTAFGFRKTATAVKKTRIVGET